MAKPECLACAWESKSGRFIDSSQTNTAWGREIGVSEASIRRHLAHSTIAAESTAFVNREDGDNLLNGIDVPEEFVTSRGMSLRDPHTGSWHKVMWQPNKKALHDTLRYNDLADALDGWVPPTIRRNPLTPVRAAVLNAADLQIGKANQRWGGTPETIASVRQSVDRFVQHLIDNDIRIAILVDNGDPIENVFNVSDQMVTNDLSVPDQIRTFRRLMLETIKLIAPHVDKLYYVAVPSNHGRFRTGYKTPGGTVDADFGLEISNQLEDATNENPYLGHLIYVRPDSLEETAELTLLGTKLAFAHGHHSGGVFKHGDWWRNMDHGRMAGGDADIFVFGHFHTQATYHSGDARYVVACSSSDPGSDWFTSKSGEYSRRGMTTFDIFASEPGVPQNVRTI